MPPVPLKVRGATGSPRQQARIALRPLVLQRWRVRAWRAQGRACQLRHWVRPLGPRPASLAALCPARPHLTTDATAHHSQTGAWDPEEDDLLYLWQVRRGQRRRPARIAGGSGASSGAVRTPIAVQRQ